MLKLINSKPHFMKMNLKLIFAIAILPLTIFSYSVSLNAQLGEFAPVGAIWYHYFEGEDEFPDYPFQYSVQNDTLIDNHYCTIIKDERYGGTEIVRSDGDQVYIYREPNFHLLFDFSAELGDTIVVFNESFTPFFNESISGPHEHFSYEILSIDTIIRNGQELIHQSINSIGDWIIYDIVESLGCVDPNACWKAGFGFLGHSYNIAFVGATYNFAYCYEIDGLKIPMCDQYNCEAWMVGIDEMDSKKEISVYPNPAKNSINFQITPDEKAKTLKLFNSMGKEVYEERIQVFQTNIKIDLIGFPSALYYWQLDGQSGKFLVE